MARPMSLSGRPGTTASMPYHMHSSVTFTSWRLAGSTSPTRNVALVSPCTPLMNAVTSMLRMSPSCNTRLSGMPWQMISLTLVHTLLG